MKSFSTFIMSCVRLIILFLYKELSLEKIVKSPLIIFIKILLQGWVKKIADIFNSFTIPKLFLRSAFVLLFLVMSFWANATNYFLTAAGAGNAQTPGSWNTIAAGGGTSATNFTTNNDVFNIPVGINGIVSANWTIGNGLSTTINLTLSVSGSLTINSGFVLTLDQKNTSTNSMSVTGSLIFLGTTATTNQLVGATAGGGNAASNTFTLLVGAILKTANAGGIASITNGSINSTNLTVLLDVGANYEFNGASQNTTGLPAIINNFTLSGTAIKTLSGSLTVNGVLTLNIVSGGVLSLGSNTLTINGLITKTAGTITTAAGSSLSFGTNAASLNLPNGLFTAAPSIANFTINRAGGVILGDQGITLTGTLTLTTGLITTGSNTISVSSTGSINSASASSYINGKLAKDITTTTATTFPIGKGGNYRPVVFTYAAVPGTKTVTMEQFEIAIPGTIPSNISIARFGNRYRTITQSLPGINYTVGLNNGGVTPTGTAVMLRGDAGTITSNATTFSTPNYTNSTPFSTTSASNDLALGETNIPLAITGVTVNNRPYDGTAVATLVTGSATLSGLVSGDVVTINSGSATGIFADKNVGVGKIITMAGFTISGTRATAYTLSQPTTTANITALALTVTASTNTKAFNGTTAAAAIPTVTSGTIQTGDAANFTEVYSDKNAGTGKTLIPSGTVTDGNSGNNYTYTFVNNTTGVISTLALTITAATNTKTYDGTISAAALPTITSGTLQPGDVANFTETYDTRNVGTGKTLTPSGIVTDGNSGNNYTYSFVTNTTGVISARALTITAATNTKTYSGTASASATPTVTSGALQTGDTPGFTETYDTKNAGTIKTLTPAGIVNDGNSGNNYTYTFAINTTGVITARALTVTAATNTKSYDGTTSAVATPIITGGIQTGDAANFIETYDTKNVGTNKVLTPAGTVSDGNSGNNYTYTFFTSSTGIINIRALTVTATTNTKTYDRTTSAAAAPTITSGALQPGDAANFTETYDTRNVGTNKTLTPAGTVTDGNGGNNYSYSFSSITSGIITGSAITITAATNTKAFDGTTSAAALPTITSGALLAGDVANFTETYDTKNAGTGKTLTPSGTVTDGNSGSNYIYTFATNTTGVINAVALTVTATGPGKTYGTGLSAGTSSTNFTASGTIAGEVVTSVTLTPNAAGLSSTTAAGASYIITPSLATGSGGFLASNYTVTYSNFVGTVSAKGLTVTANNQNKNYGTTFTFAGTEFTSSGLVNGDVVSSVTLTSSGAASTATVAGSPYAIVPSAATGTGVSNYSISYVNGMLSVSSVNQAIADFRSKASGNFSVPATWEYNPDGVWITSTLAPVSNNNINILAGHIIALDQNSTVGAGKTFLISAGGSLNITPNTTLDVVLGGTLNFNGQSVTVKSTSVGTGSIGVISGTLSGATNVTAERFIGTNKRAWRLLTTPVTGQTIRQAWAGANANPAAPSGESAGSGTLITGNGYTVGSTAAAAGFDWFNGLSSISTSSIRFYSPGAKWSGTTNTPDVLSTPTKQGYLLYVRGDRTVADATSFGITTLKPNGTLKQGTITIPVTDPFTVVGNPYASSINLDNVYNNSGNSAVINQTFYLWDATIGTSGAYRTLIGDGLGGYTMSGAPGTAADYLVVNSGQAFFVVPIGPGGNISIQENNKTTTTPQTLFRPMGTGIISSLDIDLYQAVGSTLGQQNDRVVARYNDIYNVSPTEVYDAVKLNNFNENLSLVRNNRYLSIESRPYPTQSDTLFVPFWNLSVRDYALTVTSKLFAGLNQTAILIDRFTNTQQVIDLNDVTTTHPFSITSDPASTSLNRFLIVLTPSVPLPVTFTKINANINGSKVLVTWTTGSETGVKNYDVEKGVDGSNFSKIGTVVALNAATGGSYQLMDEKPVKGNNFYRIRSNDENGKYGYSNIAVVQLNGKKGIQVTPTVISNQRFTLSLNDQPVGKYNLLLTSSSGQKVYQKVISNNGGYNSQEIELGKTFLTTGVYNLSVTDAVGKSQNFRLVIKN